MIYAATVVSQGTTEGTWSVTPLYTRIDGVEAPNIDALPINGLVPVAGDVVYCAEGINDLAQSMQLLINDNGGAYPIIFASIAPSLVYELTALQFKANVKLGEGEKKMVLGDDLATWAQKVDAALSALYAWAETGVAPGPAGGIAPFSGSPALQPWDSSTTLSQKHKLD